MSLLYNSRSSKGHGYFGSSGRFGAELQFFGVPGFSQSLSADVRNPTGVNTYFPVSICQLRTADGDVADNQRQYTTLGASDSVSSVLIVFQINDITATHAEG